MNNNLHFFQALKKLDNAGELSNTQITPAASLSFPSQDIASFTKNLTKNANANWHMTVNFWGLYGVSSVLPPFMNEAALADNADGACLRGCLNIFQNRLYKLSYEIWQQGHASCYWDTGSQYAKVLSALSGGRTLSNLSDQFNKPNRGSGAPRQQAVAGFWSHRSRSAAGLTTILGRLLRKKIQITQATPHWKPYSIADSSTRRLGDNLVLGPRYLDARKTLQVNIVCRSLSELCDFYDDEEEAALLTSTMTSYVRLDMTCQVFLKTKVDNCVTYLTGKSRLGLGATLGARRDESVFHSNFHLGCL